jgi:hypothetical protein
MKQILKMSEQLTRNICHNQVKQVWELSMSTHPTPNWITGVEIFSRKFEVFLKFVDRGLLFPTILSCKGFLGRTHDRQGLSRQRSYGWWCRDGCMCVIVMEINEEI